MSADVRFIASLSLRIPTAVQSRAREREAAASTSKLSDAQNDPTYRAARREMLDLLDGVQRLLARYGYSVGPSGAAIEAQLLVEPVLPRATSESS